MPGFNVGDGGEAFEEYPSPKKKTGSARTSKKSKRRNVIRWDWSGEQAPEATSPPGVQQQALDVEAGTEASPEPATETLILEASPEPTTETLVLEASELSPEAHPSPDHQIEETSPDKNSTAPGSFSLQDDQDEDAPNDDLHSLTAIEHIDENIEFQQAQEEQKADDWPSENLRPSAQNLRYGGYPAQPAPQNRNTPLGSARLQNASKLGVIEPSPSRIVQWSANVSWVRQVMARIGALEHLQTVRQACPVCKRAM